MAQKGAIIPYKVIDSGDMSAEIISKITDVRYLDNISYHVVWDATIPVGQCIVEVTSDNPNDPNVTPVWTELDFGTTIVVANNQGSHLININQCPFAYIRLRYVPISGTGVMDVKVEAKSLGG